jgi:hypothetical protein
MHGRALKVTLLALAIAAFSAPGASAQSLEMDSCEAAGAPHPLCAGLGKVGERASAECRRAGLANDQTCWSRVGRKVIRSEVADYERTWVHSALGFQYELANTVPFLNSPWIGTHNSANSTSEDPSLSHTDSNQQLTLPEQLRLDVRSVEIDAHWAPSARAGGANAAIACHSRPKSEMHAGCTSERLLEDRLREVDAWLEAHPDQVLLLYLEDGIEDPVGYEETGKMVARVFQGQLYTGAPGCQKLPLDRSREDVRAAHAQVVIVSDCGSGAWSNIVHSWKGDVSEEGQPGDGWDAAQRGQCPEPSAALYATRLVRFYEDSTWLTSMVGGGGRLTPDTVSKMIICGVDLFGFDQLLPFDGRLEALVWTWAGKDALPDAGECAVQRQDSRWLARDCSRMYRPACRSASGRWFVLAPRVTRAQAAQTCARAGVQLGTPRTAQENAALRSAARSAVVWLGVAPA